MRLILLVPFLCFSIIGVITPASVSALTVSPPRIEIEARRGETVRKMIRIYNDQSIAFRITSEITSVDVDAEGMQTVVTDEKVVWKTWVAEIPSFVILPGGAHDVPIQMSIPETAPSGTMVGAILFQAHDETAAKNIGIQGTIGLLAVITVTDDGIRDGSVEMDISKNGRIFGSVFDSIPQEAGLKIQNTGTLGFVPTGSLAIRNWFGGIIDGREINRERRWVLSSWTRTFREQWGAASQNGFIREWRHFGIGRYHLVADVGIGDHKKQVSIPFWVFPWRNGLVAIAVIGVVVFIKWRR